MSDNSRRSDFLFALATLIALYFAYRIRAVLLLIYVSALFAVVLSPAINVVRRIHIEDWRPGRGLAILVLAIAVLATVTLLLIFAVPPIYHDAQALKEDWPHRAAQLNARLRGIPFLENFNTSRIDRYLTTMVGGAMGLFANLAGGVFGLFSGIILTIYFILDGERAFRWALSLCPLRHRERLEKTMLRSQRRVRRWLVGQGALMLILGVASGITFGLLKVKYYYALAVFAGLANIVPILGAIASVILASTVAAMDSWTKLLGVLIFYAIYQQLENGFIIPRIMKTTVDLPPLAVVIALLTGGSLAGILGALVAVPTAALIAVFIDEYVIEKRAPDTLELRSVSLPR